MNASSFVRSLASLSHPNVFNPYADVCSVHDVRDAAALRRANLRSYLAVAEGMEVETIWMGRDLGYRGGRRTGLALTDEMHLRDMGKRYPGCSSRQATKGPALAERTAAEIWSVLHSIDRPPLLWNVFPLHPHEEGNSLSNRRFSSAELRSVEELNDALISWLKIKRIIAIGQDAAHYARRFNVKVTTVRHPSYGGVREFRDGMRALYALPAYRSPAPAQGLLAY